jgi:hypothetical protein
MGKKEHQRMNDSKWAAIPPTINAVIKLAAEITLAAFNPNSRINMLMVERQGMYNIPINARTINWTGVSARDRSVPTNDTRVKRTNSLRTTPTIKSIPAKEGSKSHPTVNGAMKLLIGPNTPRTYNT